MTRFVLLMFVLATAGCAGNYATTFDHNAAAEPLKLHLAPVLNEEEMDVQVVVADSSAATAQYGLIGALVGGIIDASVNKAREREAERKAAVLRDLTVSLDLAVLAEQTTRAVGERDRWQVSRVNKATATVGWDDLAAGVFESGDADAVVLLDFSYALTPGLDQLRADVRQRVYLRSTKANSKGIRRAASTRTFSYYSPRHPVVFRSFEDGEREELLEELKTEYENRTLARPEAAAELETELAKEIEILEDLENIPAHVAIRETWDSDMLIAYAEQSVDHLSFMIGHDWAQETVPETEERTKDRMMYITGTGMLINDKGQNIVTRDQNTVFRSHYGNMYSAPTQTDTAAE